ncbi:MAG: dihydrofolate reductase [Tenacibaculum sp.]
MLQIITLIAAIGKNNELGKENSMLWHLPADLKRFKNRTSGHCIIMGRNTFESIGKPLPNRTVIIVTRNKNYKQKGCLVAQSIKMAIKIARADAEVFIIGGAQIYKQAILCKEVNQLDITHIHHTFEADVFFPEINLGLWKETSRENFSSDKDNAYNYSFVTYKRK